ncbi:MAG: YbhB/YbcL family Raf kinase inhibitor-like protein [Dehalococcoidales bacterium]|nr:YbhB/YbcL family Raf kinase inhibitor-like protein [Dehalococcoidales bacterium]
MVCGRFGVHVARLRQTTWLLVLIGLLVLLPAACQSGDGTPLEEPGEMTLSITSPAFGDGDEIPAKYTCQGEDVSPPLAWDEPPAGTRSFAMIMDDPDAPGGTYTHWIMFNLPADSRQLAEAVPVQAELTGGALHGENSAGRTGYSGPCPPAGRAHRYQFTLYALSQVLDLKAGVTKSQVRDAMLGHILAWGQLTGTYRR